MEYKEPNLEKIKSVWKTIKLGTGLRPQDFIVLLNDDNRYFDGRIRCMLEQQAFGVRDEEIEINLVRVSAVDLGITGISVPKGATILGSDDNIGVRRFDVYERAQELGLQVCPPEVGPQLSLQYIDQPPNEKIFVAIEPIDDEYGDGNYYFPNMDIFMIRREVYRKEASFIDRDTLCFEAVSADRHIGDVYELDIFYSIDDLWVFVLPE